MVHGIISIMTTITFDKLAYVDGLKSGGFTAEQTRV
jgi:hypothetical protein